jgi:predicted transcriptional regulator YdeE
MEVESLADVPEGMIGFTIPPHLYATGKSKGDPYQVIHSFINTTEYQSNRRALGLEIYYFANPVWPDETEVFIPLQRQ